ncbi:hypothetical protein BATDEDRAFT_35503 [Batrachochytrium dendrobatidis JAM81]|uniref:GH26 domain-containing protein n=2 Tax=Batrachochytrium dendrobatidis TaxID=109871 RepID=F4P763_BATDJ|nr:uncharacterized protein BATDEDRAFT_35503 [Batrachochytrium dendrobatidis JAM81]EGF79028.1 hypothetical protein BATDEDRAFT_35503 [Batrachochytrium dendrobatidis JAM81]OAJ42372.1 hypothetical protein BDEG_25825 [Batrachochytrium dendrobatidis JEL423]|eukprot:XP_006680397.1 hypothetical protein BATDEDRAFT_35503 [Batrachochytrium dendrobatidis JAM81]
MSTTSVPTQKSITIHYKHLDSLDTKKTGHSSNTTITDSTETKPLQRRISTDSAISISSVSRRSFLLPLQEVSDEKLLEPLQKGPSQHYASAQVDSCHSSRMEESLDSITADRTMPCIPSAVLTDTAARHRLCRSSALKITTLQHSTSTTVHHCHDLAQVVPPMLQAEMTAHESYSLARPGSGAWVPLGDDDAWGAASPNRDGLPQDSSFNRSPWSRMGPWTPSSRSWQIPTRGIGPDNGFGMSRRQLMRRQWSRICCIRVGILAGIGLVLTIVIAVVIVTHLHQTPVVFDASAGPRGSIPGSPPGPPLPVLGVLGLGNPSGRPAIYFGASIDWDNNDPENFNNDFGHAAAIQDSFFYMTSSALLTSANVNSSGILHTVSDSFAWTAALIRGTGAIMGVTVIPLAPLSSIQNDVLVSLARKCKSINSIGVPILLRYAPQMNGNWFPYGQDPKAYRESFVKLANMVHNTTNNTAMVWSPVSALSYPFPGGRFFPNQTESRFQQLDTNQDGVFNAEDDPFLPYYPGDDAVDWVGISTFYTSSNPARSFYPIPAGMPYPFPPVSQTANTTSAAPSDVKAISFPAFNESSGLPIHMQSRHSTVNGTPLPSTSSIPSPKLKSDSLTLLSYPLSGPGLADTAGNSYSPYASTFPAIPTYDNLPLPSRSIGPNSTSFEAHLTSGGSQYNFYSIYAKGHQKPLIVSETGAAYYPSGRQLGLNATEMSIKGEWRRQVFDYDLLQKYPLIRAIVMFNKIVPLQATSLYLGKSTFSESLHSTAVADFTLTENSQVLQAFNMDLLPLILAANAPMDSNSSVTNGTDNGIAQTPPLSIGLQPQTLNISGFLIFANGTAVLLNGSWTVSGARMAPQVEPDQSKPILQDPTFTNITNTATP